ncbi:hypothetical protein TURU_076810 [Turdus rufiventris]|nr:hypothetical protein TURU_076810 [Turdus rufiventris]
MDTTPDQQRPTTTPSLPWRCLPWLSQSIFSCPWEDGSAVCSWTGHQPEELNTTNSLSLPATNFTKPNREKRDGGPVKRHMDIARTAHHEFSTPSGPVLASEKQFSHKPSHEAITHQHTALMLLQNSRKGSIPI